MRLKTQPKSVAGRLVLTYTEEKFKNIIYSSGGDVAVDASIAPSERSSDDMAQAWPVRRKWRFHAS